MVSKLSKNKILEARHLSITIVSYKERSRNLKSGKAEIRSKLGFQLLVRIDCKRCRRIARSNLYFLGRSTGLTILS